MEGLLLTFDVLAIIILGFAVIKVRRTGDEKYLGWFSYTENTARKKKL